MGGSLGSYILAPSALIYFDFDFSLFFDSIQGGSSASDSESPLTNPSPRL